MNESAGTGAHRFPVSGFTPGYVLGAGRYRLLAEVARDDRCAVRLWRGRDLMLDRDIALTLFTAAPTDPAAVARVRSAVARALRSARVETAGAARVLDVLEPEHIDDPHGTSGTDGSHAAVVAAVVAEWTPGGPLAELLDGGPLPPGVAARILVPLAGAVDTAHSAGLVLGCDHPGRIRVAPDRQLRLAFPGPPPSTGARDDIRGLGAMLYLLLTGCWPLLDGPPGLPPAPLGPQGGPISPTTLRPVVPVELSTLALRSIAGPGTGGVHTGAAVRQVLEFHAASADDLRSGAQPIDPQRARRLRRIKFGVSMTVLGAATLMIIGYAGMQVVSVFTDTGGAPLVVAGTAPARPAPAPPALLAPVRVRSLSVYDPSGLGSPDHQKDVAKLVDGNPRTGWSTDSYFQQFPIYKKGLGVMLSFETPVSAASVTVVSPSAGTMLEIRTAMSPNARLDQTTLVGTATLKSGSNQIPLRAGSPARYLLVWITGLSGGEGHHQSQLSDLQIQQRAT
ncbi:MAG TPA: protein kinase family protein [Pseudonocardiaceae bacterium]|nr:protein kinase family protein [Pseudonocardiaceae bacterium]